MYYVMISLLMLVLPLLCIAAECLYFGAALDAALVAKWFAFWAVGWRLFLAGAKQMAQPRYTAREILGLKSDESLILVRELGFANVAIGLVGVLSLWVPSWRLAAAFAGGLFYGLSFGLGGVAAAGIGLLADKIGIIEVFRICAWLPAFGLLTFLLPKSGRQS